MNLGHIARLCQKELRETLRDRRTIGTLLLMPILVYPVLSLVMQRYLAGMAFQGPAEYQVVTGSEHEGALLRSFLDEARLSRPSNDDAAEPIFQLGFTEESPDDVLVSRRAQGWVSIQEGSPTRIQLRYLKGDPQGRVVARLLRERLNQANLSFMSAALRQAGKSGIAPLMIDDSEVADLHQPPPLLATVVPLMLVLMTITGAVYPAIDLTAGERERGTIEAVIASPVSRTALLLAKYVAVVSVALLTAIANLVAMIVTLKSGGFLSLVVGEQGLPWLTVLQVLGLLVLFAAFFAGVLLALTSVARSFKEAQAYLIPIMLLSLTPGVLSLKPDIRLEGWLSIVPLANIVLLTRDVLIHQVAASAATITIVSTLVYAIAGITLAAQIFGADALTRGSERSVGTLLTRPKTVSDRPSLSQAMLGVAMVFPLGYLVSSAVAQSIREQDLDPVLATRQLLIQLAFVAAVVYGGVPLFFLWLGRVRVKSGMRIHSFPLAILPAVVVLGGTLWMFAHELILMAEQTGVVGIDDATMERARQAVEGFRKQPLWLVLLAFAVAPALFEEILFRGFLFSALRPTGAGRTVALTAICFGAFHLVSGNQFTPERFLPSTLLGFVLGWVALRNGSVMPGIFVHAIHNGLLLVAISYTDQLKAWGIGIEERSHLPITWLVTAVVCVIAAIAWIRLTTRGLSSASPAEDANPQRTIS